MPDSEDTFDYIVTGAGSAGAVVAARLSESGRHRVLLLEAGGRDTSPWIHIPIGFARTFIDPAVNWKSRERAATRRLGNRRLYLPRGKGSRRHQLDQRHGLYPLAIPPTTTNGASAVRRLGLGFRSAFLQKSTKSAARR